MPERNCYERFGDNKKKSSQSSSHVLYAASKQVISLEGNGAKCTKLKHARAKRAKLLVFIVKYANFLRPPLPSRPCFLSSLKSFPHGP